jgi:methionyl-tRNA formyltransferase
MESLDPSEAAEVLGRKVRALSPWPGTSVLVRQGSQSVRLKIKRVKLRGDIEGGKGQIFERSGMVLLGTSKGSLEILSMQWDGKKETDPASFLNGLKGRGEKLPLELVTQEK